MTECKSCKLPIFINQSNIARALGIKPKSAILCDDCEQIKELKTELKETKREMKEYGIRVTSFLNRQVSQQATYYNNKIFRLKCEIEKLTK